MRFASVNRNFFEERDASRIVPGWRTPAVHHTRKQVVRIQDWANGEEKTGDVLYKGIAERPSSLASSLPTMLRSSARLANGLLHVDLVREIPEAMKPRAIPIASPSRLVDVKPTKAAA